METGKRVQAKTRRNAEEVIGWRTFYRLILVRPYERNPGLSGPHRYSCLLDFRRVAPRLGNVLAREFVQVDSSVCCADHGCYRSCLFGNCVRRYVVFSALGAVDLYCASCCWIARKPVSSAWIFSIVAAFVSCPSRRTYTDHHGCHSHDVLSATGARLFSQEGGLTNR